MFLSHFSTFQYSFQVTLGKTLRAVIVLRGLLIEWVSVKGYHEEVYKENKQVCLQTFPFIFCGTINFCVVCTHCPLPLNYFQEKLSLKNVE